MVNAPLKNTTTMTVSSNLHAMSCHGIIDKLVVLGTEMVQAALHNVVSVEVFNQWYYGGLESAGDQADLLLIKIFFFKKKVSNRKMKSNSLTINEI